MRDEMERKMAGDGDESLGLSHSRTRAGQERKIRIKKK